MESMNSVPPLSNLPALNPPVSDQKNPPQEAVATRVHVIESRSGWRVFDLLEIWRYREVLYFLTWRDIKVRYKQSVLGVAWVLIQPLLAMMVFAVFLGRLAGLSGASGESYALFVFTGILPWTFFANAIGSAGNSVVLNERLVTKIWFPRIIVPLSSVAAALFDFCIAMILLVIMMAGYGIVPSWQILLAPVMLLLLIMAAVGMGSLLAALIVSHRDFRYVLTFGVQLWMFATPSIYLSPQTFGPLAHTWLPFNPVYGLILNFRQAILGGPFDGYALAVSAVVSAAIFVIGVGYFRRVERSFADII
jgi:lipopolysaccharide transport system permease protein